VQCAYRKRAARSTLLRLCRQKAQLTLFPNKLKHEEALSRFSILDRRAQASEEEGEEGQSQNAVKMLMGSALHKLETKDDKGAIVRAFTCGNSWVYFRKGALEYMESARNDSLGVFAVTIQKCVRRHYAYQFYRALLRFTIKTQANARRENGRRTFLRLRSTVISVQMVHRQKVARRKLLRRARRKARNALNPNNTEEGTLDHFSVKYLQIRSAVISVQCAYRQRVARRTFLRLYRRKARLTLFPHRLRYEVALHRFSILGGRVKASKEGGEGGFSRMMLESLLESTLQKLETKDKKGAIVKAFVCGKSWIYFRQGALECMESARNESLEPFAVTIQKCVRQYYGSSRHKKGTQEFLRLRSAVISVQCAYRKRAARSTLLRLCRQKAQLTLFPNKLKHEEALSRFSILDRRAQASEEEGEEGQSQNAVKMLMGSALHKLETKDDKGAIVRAFTCGNSWVYFRKGALEYMESARNDSLGVFAVTIQKCVRRHYAYQFYRALLRFTIKTQANARRENGRRTFLRLRSTVISVQMVHRQKVARRKLLRRARRKARNALNPNNTEEGTLDHFSVKYLQIRSAVISVQCAYRQRVARRTFLRLYRRKARLTLFPHRLRYEVALHRFSILGGRVKASKEGGEGGFSRMMLESLLESTLQKLETKDKKGAIVKAFVCGKSWIYFRQGALECMESACNDFLKDFAVTIQKYVRRHYAYQVYCSKLHYIIKFQANARRKKGRQAFLWIRSTVISLQCAHRRRAARRILFRQARLILFPNKLTHKETLDRFSILGKRATASQEEGEQGGRRRVVERLLGNALCKLETKDEDGIIVRAFICGKALVYFRQGALEHMESARKYCTTLHYAIKTQANVRREKGRQSFLRLRSAVVSVQCAHRQRAAQRTLLHLYRYNAQRTLSRLWKYEMHLKITPTSVKDIGLCVG